MGPGSTRGRGPQILHQRDKPVQGKPTTGPACSGLPCRVRLLSEQVTCRLVAAPLFTVFPAWNVSSCFPFTLPPPS